LDSSKLKYYLLFSSESPGGGQFYAGRGLQPRPYRFRAKTLRTGFQTPSSTDFFPMPDGVCNPVRDVPMPDGVCNPVRDVSCILCRLSVHGFKSLDNFHSDLEPALTIFIGQNGAEKSTLLQIFIFFEERA
jgi:ABC-type antimicrobial peptide transport system ATPase subunit